MHTSHLIQLRGHSPLQRCGVCIASVASRRRPPPRGFFTFSAQRRYVFTAALYISQQTTPPHSVVSPPPRYATAYTASCPASSGLSIHGTGESNCREGAAPRINRGSPPAHLRDLYVMYSSLESLGLISTSPAGLSGLSQRVERRPLLKTSCQPASCRASSVSLALAGIVRLPARVARRMD